MQLIGLPYARFSQDIPIFRHCPGVSPGQSYVPVFLILSEDLFSRDLLFSSKFFLTNVPIHHSDNKVCLAINQGFNRKEIFSGSFRFKRSENTSTNYIN